MDRLSKRETGVEKRKGKGKESEREKIITLQKGKRGIMQIVFGRTGIVVLFLLMQALILLVGFGLLRPYIVILFGGYAVFGLIIAIIIINREENPAFQIAWLIPVLLIPFFGGLFYLFVQSQLGHRILHRRMSVLIDETRKYAQQKNSVTLELVEKNPAEWRLAQYAFS